MDSGITVLPAEETKLPNPLVFVPDTLDGSNVPTPPPKLDYRELVGTIFRG